MRGITHSLRKLWRCWLWPVVTVCWLTGLVTLAGCNNSPYPAGAERENTMFYSYD